MGSLMTRMGGLAYHSHVYRNGIVLKKVLAGVVIACFLLSIASCASIVSKSSYPVAIVSSPESAMLTIVNDEGEEIFRGQTPATVTLRAGKAYFHKCSYDATFEKEGYDARTVKINSSLDGWYIGNLLFGGLIGILIVDPLTGAMWTLDSEMTVELTEMAPETEPDSVSLQVVEMEDVPQDLRRRMVRIR